jgi:shikimate kinase/3-dehydroquinate synthase
VNAKRHLALVGLMGAGKSTVGRLLARRLDLPFVDVDAVIVERGGRSVAEIFEAEGEAGFRQRERAALEEVLAGPDAVVACGGGAVLDPGNRAALQRAATVVWLDALPEVLAARVGADPDRPLLGDRPVEALRRLAAARAEAYAAVADATVRADAEPETVVDRVALARHGIVLDALERLGDWTRGRRRVAVVTQQPVADALRGRLAPALGDVAHEVLQIGEGEDHKTLATIEDLTRAFARSGLLRDDLVVAVGGGMVGDVAGFAAAVYHRGIDVVQMPTTLLAMVDAAIGGKTAVNLPEGKNLVGAFHPPLAVLVDPSVLATLPEAEFRCGLGEVAKYALMGDAELERTLLDHGEAVKRRDPAVLDRVVARCAARKADVVARDPQERSGLRATLNYGHTLAHALETVGGYDLRHGEAVAVGLVFAAELAGALERIGAADVERHHRLVTALDLPASAPPGLRADALLAVMRRDKKAAGGLTFVLQGPAGLERVDDPDPAAVAKAMAAVGIPA